ncbi:hypothetical protein Tco_0803906 [Tanacetum coccineum]|uniref:Uncharacterized protein n=1 Tax=Tanacetum coccineum TaxID=301880 RepID=A0ABQ5A787_9ASTR
MEYLRLRIPYEELPNMNWSRHRHLYHHTLMCLPVEVGGSCTPYHRLHCYTEPEEDEEDPANYPADGGDDDDDNESSDDDDDDVDDVEDDNEEEEHLAPVESTAVASPAIDHVPSAEET